MKTIRDTDKIDNYMWKVNDKIWDEIYHNLFSFDRDDAYYELFRPTSFEIGTAFIFIPELIII